MSVNCTGVHHLWLVSTRLVLSRVTVAVDVSMMLHRKLALVIKTYRSKFGD